MVLIPLGQPPEAPAGTSGHSRSPPRNRCGDRHEESARPYRYRLSPPADHPHSPRRRQDSRFHTRALRNADRSSESSNSSRPRYSAGSSIGRSDSRERRGYQHDHQCGRRPRATHPADNRYYDDNAQYRRGEDRMAQERQCRYVCRNCGRHRSFHEDQHHNDADGSRNPRREVRLGMSIGGCDSKKYIYPSRLPGFAREGDGESYHQEQADWPLHCCPLAYTIAAQNMGRERNNATSNDGQLGSRSLAIRQKANHIS